MRLLLFLLALALPISAAAQENGHELRYDWRVHLPLTVVASTTWILSGIFEAELMRKDCWWCGRDSNGKSTVNGLDSGVRDGLKWGNTQAAHTASNVLDQGIMPATLVGLTALASHHEGRIRDLPVDVLIVLEAMTLGSNLSQATKMVVGRERPFVHALPADQRGQTESPSDNNTSFYSGHTSRAFSLAVAAGTVAWLRGYRWAPWIWAAGLSVATSIGYLRIAADKHYFTDVLVGAAMGSAFGFGVPYLLHGRVSQGGGATSPRLTLAIPCSSHHTMLVARYVW